MKKLLLTFGLLLACVFSFSQIIQPKTTPNFQQFGSPQTWTQTNGISYPVLGLVNSEYADTVSANLIPYVKNAPGVQIRIGDNIWLRSYDAKKWLLIPTQGIVVDGDSINYLVDVNRPPGQLNVYGKFFNGVNSYERLMYTDSIGSGGGSSYTFTNGLVDNGSGAVGLDSNGVNPLTRNVLIDADGNDFTIQNASVVSLESNNGGDNSGTIEVQPTQIQIQVEESGTGSNIIYMNKDSTKFQFFKGQANIDSLREASNMTNKAVMVWETTTGRWERINKDSIGSGGGSSYTFPYSVVAPGSAIQLENDTTANPANYFYGRNSAGRRGWYPQSGITGVNLFNSDGTLTGYRTVNGNYNGFEMVNISSLSINIDGNEGMTGGIDISGDNADNNYHIRTIGSVGESGIHGYRSENKLYSVTAGDSSFVQTDGENGISIKAFDGSLKIPLLNATTDTTGKSLVMRRKSDGFLYDIDPALIGGGGITNADNGLVKNSSGVVGLDSNGVNPLTRVVEINANNNQFIIDQATNLELTGIYSYLYGAAYSELRTPHSFIRVKSDSILIEPYLGKLKIDTLNNETSQNKLMGWVETTGADRGKVGYVTIGSGLSLSSGVLSASGGSSGITVGTTTITSGTNKRIPFNNSGVYSESANLTQETNQIKVTGTSSTTPLLVDAHEDATAEILQVNDNATKVFSVNVDGVLDLSDNSSAPSTPASGYGKVYSRADSLRFKNDAGTEFTLGAGGGSTDSTVVRNQRWKYRNTFEDMNDFAGNNTYGLNGWSGYATGSGATALDNTSIVPADSTYFGAIRMITGTTSTGKAFSYYGPGNSGGGEAYRAMNNKKTVLEFGSVWFPYLSDSTGGTEIYSSLFGLSDYWADVSYGGIHLVYNRSSYGNYWVLRSGASVVITTTPVTAATRQTLRIEVSDWNKTNAGGSIRAYVNDVEVVASSGTYPIVTNLPTGGSLAGEKYYPIIGMQKTAGTTSRSVYVDWAYQYVEFVNR